MTGKCIHSLSQPGKHKSRKSLVSSGGERGKHISAQKIEMDVKGKCLDVDRTLGKEGINADECNDSLLMLAHSAEFVLNSGNKASDMDRISKDCEEGLLNPDEAQCTSEILSNNATAGSRDDGVQGTDRILRLSQIRHLARSKNNLLVQQRIGGCTDGLLLGRRVRLTKIRQEARSKNHPEPQGSIQNHESENSQGRTLRLSRLRCQARSKNNSVAPTSNL